MFRRIFLICILTSIVLCGCTNQNDKRDLYKAVLQKDKIIVGVSFDSKPFSFKDNDGKIKGMEADIIRELAERILGDKNKVEFKNVTSEERIPITKTGDVDMVISTMTITPQRKKLVNFSVPYFVAGQAICVKKNSKIDSYDDLNNKRVIVVLGTTSEKNIKRFAPNALIEAYADNTKALQAFKNGYGDALTTDDSLLQGFIMDNKDYEILPERLTKEPYGIAYSKSRLSNSLRKNVDDILNEIMFNGTFEKIKNKWEIY